MLEQTAEDHGVRDLRDVELVEAEQARLVGDTFGGGCDGIIARIPHISRVPAPLARAQLAPLEDEGVRLQHEVMEMDALLLLQRHRLEEQVHQHGLAASNLAPDVEPAGPASAAEPSPRCRQPTRQIVQPRDGFALRRIWRETPVGEAVCVELFDTCHLLPRIAGFRVEGEAVLRRAGRPLPLRRLPGVSHGIASGAAALVVQRAQVR